MLNRPKFIKKNTPIVNLVRQSLKFERRFPHLHAKKKEGY